MKKILSFLIIFSLVNCSVIFKRKPELLFVQSAKSAIYDGKVLRLESVSKNTIYFSDRPYRTVGHIKNADFLKDWNNQKQQDSFKKDPPNAAISYYDKDGKVDVAIVELSNFKVEKNYASYDVKILQGKLLGDMREVTAFIDDLNLVFTQTQGDLNNSSVICFQNNVQSC